MEDRLHRTWCHIRGQPNLEVRLRPSIYPLDQGVKIKIKNLGHVWHKIRKVVPYLGNQSAANTDKAKSIPSDQYDTDSDSDDDSLIIIIDPELFSMTEANFCVLLLDWVLFEHECAVRGTELALEFEKQRSRLKQGLQSVLDYCIRAPNKGWKIDFAY